MKISNKRTLLLLVLCFAFSAAAFGQAGMLKRTTTKTDRLDFGSGGTLALTGAPNGSVTVEGWSNNEIEIIAEVEVQAPNEADLAKMADITGFVLEESIGRTGIVTVGLHDRKFSKTLKKRFKKKDLKRLALLPFRVDYVVRVPRYCDLQIDGGTGDLAISGVEGVMKINYVNTNARLDLVGGGIAATFGSGTVQVTIPTRAWRGRFADIQMAAGDLNIFLPPSLNAELDATILRTGKIENSYTEMKPRVRKGEFTEKSIVAKAGNGGIPLKFSVGDGTLKLSPLTLAKK